MIGRFLDDGDRRKLHRTLIKKKPPAPSVRRHRPQSSRRLPSRNERANHRNHDVEMQANLGSVRLFLRND
jgi:hypothetical protein